jgi:putative hydrolase of the HAD superfamily
MLPVDELFEVVVDSAFVGMRKPEPGIYHLTLERLDLPAEACAFVDDLEPNCAAARELGLTAVRFQDTDQAIRDLRAALDAGA